MGCEISTDKEVCYLDELINIHWAGAPPGSRINYYNKVWTQALPEEEGDTHYWAPRQPGTYTIELIGDNCYASVTIEAVCTDYLIVPVITGGSMPKPINGAEVIIEGQESCITGRATLPSGASMDGVCVFHGLSCVPYTITVLKEGYVPESRSGLYPSTRMRGVALNPIECMAGDERCIGADLFTCIDNRWALKMGNSPRCGYEPPAPPPPEECEDGEQKCEGVNLFRCMNNKWMLTDYDSPECGFVPPPPPEECEDEEQKCEGKNLYECFGGKWVLVEHNSELCHPPSPIPFLTILAGLAAGGAMMWM